MMEPKASGSPRRSRTIASGAPPSASGFMAAARIIAPTDIRARPRERPILNRNPSVAGRSLTVAVRCGLLTANTSTPNRDRQGVFAWPCGPKSDEDVLEGGLHPARGFSLARVGGAKAPRGLKP